MIARCRCSSVGRDYAQDVRSWLIQTVPCPHFRANHPAGSKDVRCSAHKNVGYDEGRGYCLALKTKKNKQNSEKNGGGSGIRTRDTVSRIHTFQACAFNHSATPPAEARSGL